jgi:light-regulated signal transduction histidine kinase (bacteriophytochrome)
LTANSAEYREFASWLEENEARRDFQNCEDEPIRTPGSIQRHGFLLILDPEQQHVIAASENTTEFLDVPLRLILGARLDTVLPLEILGALRGFPLSGEGLASLTYLGSFQLRNGLYSVVAHRVGGERVVEFERVDRLVSPELTNQVITNFVNKLSKITAVDELCAAITKQVKDLTGFNRILLYRFDEAGHGTVLCEENDGVLPSYLGLRFPATDIPRQARELYILNTVRIIPDANYVPSPLRGDSGHYAGTFDLSMSILRSVSPIHLQYMKNMGTTASMSISIVCEGKLWGLISGHHAEARTLPYLVRSSCDLLTKLVGTQLISFRANTKLERMVHFHAVQRRILMHVAAEQDYLSAMAQQMDSLMSVTDSSGAALIVEGRLTTAGQTPGHPSILKLASWMDANPELNCFESEQLARNIPWASEFAETGSGLMVIRVSDFKQSYVMWFRPEVQRTVTWAGDPKKKDEDMSLRPRGSFEAWKELVRGQSRPWTEMELDSALEFRAAVMTIRLKRSEEAVHLGEARFSQLTQALPNLVWTSDNEGSLTYVNQLWIEQGLGAHGIWFRETRLVPEDELKCGDLWAKAVSDAAPFECELRFRSSSTTPDERWHMVRAAPFLRSDGTRAGWVGTCTDLTDKHQRELALRMAEKLALTGRLTSVIAHEINNPLEAIGNLLYLLSAKMEVDSESHSYVQLIESELLRISGITKQTLRWSSESSQNAEYGTVGPIFEDVLRLYAGKIRNKEITVIVGDGKNVRFFGQIGQITQVIANLISNAIQAVPVGGKFWLSASEEGETMSIVVRDAGHGMDRDTLRHIFQPFFTTKGDLGNGLGLYISKEIVERHGGSLIVQSELQVGTKIQVQLPTRDNGQSVDAKSLELLKEG